MQSKTLYKSILNTLVYSLIAISIYLLYAPQNKHLNNTTRSAIQFVYQQF
jgi:hypothetical protein